MTHLTYRSPKTEVCASPIQGKGLFAKVPIAEGGIVAVKGGYILTGTEWATLEKTLGRTWRSVRLGWKSRPWIFRQKRMDAAC